LFDGIDIDWEWSSASVNQEQSESYTYFIKQLRKVLDDKQKRIKKSEKYILSAALQASPGVYQSLNFTALSKHVDWFNFMAYDFFGPSSGIVALHTPICGNPTKYSLDGALHGLFEQGLSPDKIVLGIPSYGYIYDNTMGMKATFAKNDNTKAISFAIIQQKYAKDRRFIKRWHDVERVPSLYSSIEKTFISYDDIRSVNQKVGFSKQNRLAGVMLWNLAGDDERHTLVSAITHALQV
jgi:chitinase